MVQIQDRAISSCLAIIILQHATEAIAVLNDSIGERDDIRASVTEPLAENAIFLLEIVNHVELLTVHPTSEDNEQELQWRKDIEHGGARLYQPLPS